MNAVTITQAALALRDQLYNAKVAETAGGIDTYKSMMFHGLNSIIRMIDDYGDEVGSLRSRLERQKATIDKLRNAQKA